MAIVKNKHPSGFTIVELLIVIVVIGILAAITIVAYNGVQSRAQYTRLLSAFDTYEKSLHMYKQLHGSYPDPDGAVVCMGEHYPQTVLFDEGYCAGETLRAIAPNSYKPSATINAQLKSVVSTLPDVSMSEFNHDPFVVRGIFYQNANISGTIKLIGYYATGKGSCGRGNDTTSESDLVTVCTLELNE